MDVERAESFDLNLGHELWQLVQSSFLLPPIIVVAPEVERFAHELVCDAIVLAPLFLGGLCRQTSKLEFAAEKVQFRVWNANLFGAVSLLTTKGTR